MEVSPNSETKPRVRRRLIQSTLFPHKSQDNVVCVDEEIKPDVDLEDDEDDNCGSQSQVKKSKKRKPKTASQSRASRKLAVNGTEIGQKNTDEEDSPAPVKDDFFVKVSERRKRQQKEQLPILSPEKIEESCSPSDVITNSKSPRKPRRRANTTPKKRQTSVTPQKQQINSTSKDGINGVLSEDYLDKMLSSPPKQIPDLRLEAKMTAEENSRIFAGKQIHPFFSSRKTGKKNTDCTDTENKWCHAGKKESNNDFSPVHIFEQSQIETFSVDWRNWTFSKSIPSRTSQDPEESCSHLINKGLVNCLQFDNFHDITPPGISLCQNIKVDEDGKTGGFSDNSTFVVNLDSERMTSTDQNSANSLWTTKYQPEKAIEICGNSESVKVLNEWLQQWHEKGSRTNKCSTDGNNWVMQDVDLNYCPSDTDSEYSNEENSLKNVLLITGPVGSGKSAAIYACAKEQGFQVIEVNTSDWRNGAVVKQKFGEAVESHWLQCSMASLENPDNKSQLKSTPTNGVVELSDDEDSKDVNGPGLKPTNSQNGTKTLILFEDVDVTTYEDRGFIATIQQLAETAKRPMILTSNSNDPDLPNNLDRIEVSFKIPSSDDLLRLANMVCAVEKTEIDPCLAERFINHCHGDIRKIITLLQFWCQGQNQRKDNEVRNTYSPLLFDTNAAHHVLPQIIPFGYASKLSELIDDEITKSTLLTQKEDIFMETIEEEDENNNNTPDNDIDSKKDEMLRIHCYEQEENCVSFSKRTLQKKYDLVISYESEPSWNEDLNNLTDDLNLNEEMLIESRNSRKKYNAVLSSDSDEEECFNDDTCHPSEVNVDVSCVPESFYVPETEMENGTTMCFSGGVDSGMETGPTNCVTDNHDYGCEEDKAVRVLGLDNEQVQGEEIGDSHIEPTEAILRDYQMMDECSRIDFSKKIKSESNHGSIFGGSTDSIHETWRKLRNCSQDLSQYVSVEEENRTLEALHVSYGMTNLISEADLLLADCQSLTCDNLKASMISYEKSHSHSWHDDQLQMASTFGQHGFCAFAKRSFASGSSNKMDLAFEMLAASTNANSLGKLINQNNNMIKSLGNQKLQSEVYSKSILESPICNTIRSIVPSRLQLSLKGYVFHEYLSSLANISRSESSRLSEAVNNSNQRRKRVARNYLSNGALSLSSEDISLLDQYKNYQKQ